ncbi:MAG TPA: hypothetical protein VNO70_26755 [Blastocatellia bacterium]|nr:hypothetical protein [Blastocatellia bacterium]
MNPETMTAEELKEYFEWQERQYAASANNSDDDPYDEDWHDWRVRNGWAR